MRTSPLVVSAFAEACAFEEGPPPPWLEAAEYTSGLVACGKVPIDGVAVMGIKSIPVNKNLRWINECGGTGGNNSKSSLNSFDTKLLKSG